MGHDGHGSSWLYFLPFGTYVRASSSDKVPYHQLLRILAYIWTTPSGKNRLRFSPMHTPSRGGFDSEGSLSRFISQGTSLFQPWCGKSNLSLSRPCRDERSWQKTHVTSCLVDGLTDLQYSPYANQTILPCKALLILGHIVLELR